MWRRFPNMACRIDVLERISDDIRKPVETLRIGEIGYNRIGLDPTVKIRVVISSVVKVHNPIVSSSR
jgi:hypothetical protein